MSAENQCIGKSHKTPAKYLIRFGVTVAEKPYTEPKEIGHTCLTSYVSSGFLVEAYYSLLELYSWGNKRELDL